MINHQLWLQATANGEDSKGRLAVFRYWIFFHRAWEERWKIRGWQQKKLNRPLPLEWRKEVSREGREQLVILLQSWTDPDRSKWTLALARSQSWRFTSHHLNNSPAGRRIHRSDINLSLSVDAATAATATDSQQSSPYSCWSKRRWKENNNVWNDFFITGPEPGLIFDVSKAKYIWLSS